MASQARWVKDYLHRLDVPLSQPSWDYLSQICSAHLNRFPFENISKLLFYRDSSKHRTLTPSIETFLRNREEWDFGGNCFTINWSLVNLLTELGFDAYLINLSRRHMAIIVTIPEFGGERVYVDCGAAAPVFAPIRFETDVENETRFGGDVIHIRKHESAPTRYEYRRYMNGVQTGETWVFDAEHRQTIESFTGIIEAANQPGTTFMTMLRCQIWQLDRRRSVSLSNNILSLRKDTGEVTKYTLKTVQDLENAMHEEFQLPKLPVRDALNVLNGLNVDIFATSP